MNQSEIKPWRRSLVASIVATVPGYCSLLCIEIYFLIRVDLPVLVWESVPAHLWGVFVLAWQWLSLPMVMLIAAGLYYKQKLRLYRCLITGAMCALFRYTYRRYDMVGYYGGFWESLTAGVALSLLPQLAACLVYATTFWLQWNYGRARVCS